MKNPACTLCLGDSKEIFEQRYYECQVCAGIFLSDKFYISKEAEKLHYESHNNDIYDLRYQKFVSPITNKVFLNFKSYHEGLDFGAGTGPVISKVLRDKGYQIVEYDPFFNSDMKPLERQYDYIVCCEVIEHFHKPAKEFSLLRSLLKPNGILYCMTECYDSSIAFESWYYKNDPTHVFFYRDKTLEWIKEKFNFSSHKREGRLVAFYV
jgi:SAM-dependent methyltransferase